MNSTTRKEQKIKTRAGLVKSAEYLFAKNGISRTTTSDISKALKVSHGTVFVHFSNRDSLIQAVVEQFGDRLSEALGKSLSKELPLLELLQAHLTVLAEFEDFYLRLITESQFLPPKIRSIQYGMNASVSFVLYQAAQKLMKKGEIKKFDQATFFNTWMSLIHYYVMNRDLFANNTPILRESSHKILQQFLYLIKNE